VKPEMRQRTVATEMMDIAEVLLKSEVEIISLLRSLER
jgi:hypothetical protein